MRASSRIPSGRGCLGTEEDAVAEKLRPHLSLGGKGGAAAWLQHLAHRYLGPDVRFPPMPDPPPGWRLRIEVERVGGIGPWSA